MTEASGTCRFCSGTVPVGARKCQHCGEWLVRRRNPLVGALRMFAFLVLTLILVGIVLNALSARAEDDADAERKAKDTVDCIGNGGSAEECD